ncbi:MAG: DUF1499 domain-containing protein [Nitrospira sp.]|nr:DUF1499 domain-containing protein [Candidatus Manganitrophaceae bacterium]HIL34819.1 DUF1499 domain-containing protein [Candidatus Manganitrophaceae bacterium]
MEIQDRLGRPLVFSVIIMMVLAFNSCRGLMNNRAETKPDHSDTSLRTRTYTATYESFFETAAHVTGWLPRWEVVEQDIENGKIRATRQTRIFHFVDDVEISVKRVNENTLTLDVLSTSRVGKGDFGQNGRNIREFLKGIDGEIGSNNPR